MRPRNTFGVAATAFQTFVRCRDTHLVLCTYVRVGTRIVCLMPRGDHEKIID